MLTGAPGLRKLVVDLASQFPALSLPVWGAERLQSGAPEGWEVVITSSPTDSRGDGNESVSEEVRAAVATAEAYFGFGLPEALLHAAPKLRWAHSGSAGVGSALTPTLRASTVVFTNSAGVYGEAMADNVLAGVLHFVRSLDLAVRQQADRVWDSLAFHAPSTAPAELSSLRVLVVGTGGIGSAVARRFSALGARVTGVRRRPELGAPVGFERVVGTDRLDEELGAADVLVLAAPLTGMTRALIGAAELALLPSGAIVVNVARGDLVDERAVVAMLDAGRLRGACLDVFQEEPLPETSALWSHPRVLITPHVSGVSPARHWGRALALFEDNWRRYVAGEPLRNVVDPTAGY